MFKVIPMHKDGENILSKYRSIASIPTIGKLFEKVAYERLLTFVTKYSIICPEQLSFRKGTSNQDAFLALSVILVIN